MPKEKPHSQPNVIKKTLKIWFSHLKPFRQLILLSMLVKFVANICANILVPIEIGRIINRLANDQATANNFIVTGLIYIGCLLFLSIVLDYVWNRLNTHYLVRARKNLESEVFKKLINKSWSFHAESFTGSVVSQFNRFIAAFQYFHDTLFKDLYSIAINFAASIAVTIVISPVVGGVMIAWTIAYVAIISQLSRTRYYRKRESSKNVSKVTGHLSDVLSNMITIKIFARESYENSLFRTKLSAKMKASEAAWNWSALTSAIISFLMAVLNLSVLLISASLLKNNAMTIGTLVLLQVLTIRLSMQLWQLGAILRDFDRSFAESSEMTEILTNIPEIHDRTPIRSASIKQGRIELKNIEFEYPDENSIPKFFEKLSLSIQPGEKVGIVGPSGSGKTTILKLILRLAEPSSGSIEIDGIDIAGIRRSHLRNAISYVPQEPILFHRSILENIRYAKPDATEKEIELAARKSRANIFINRLPKGYDTLVGERGVKLSTGQRQRIGIARAMLKRSPILILDEATSAIDSESEKLIQKSLDALMSKRTTLIVAHRFSTIRKMDRIIFLSYGRIIEQGTHEELITKNGPYAKLWAHQSGEFIEPESFL